MKCWWNVGSAGGMLVKCWWNVGSVGGMLVKCWWNQHSRQPKTEGCCALLFLPVPSCFFQRPFVSTVDFLSKD